MIELVETIAKALVDDPNDVHVFETKDPLGEVNIDLEVNEKDMGKVIGRQGKIAKAIRTVVKAAAILEDVHVNLHIDKVQSESDGNE